MKITPFVRALFLLLAGLLAQSCETFKPTIDASFEDTQIYQGQTSYYVTNDEKGPALGFNIVFSHFIGLGASNSSTLYSNPPATKTLMASTSNRLSFGSGYTPPKPTSFFTSDRFALMPALELVQKGGKTKYAGGSDVTRLLYLELPVYAIYRHYLPDNKGELFGGLGPYFGYGLSGTFKSTFNGQAFSSPAFDATNGGLKRFDAGLAFTVGYQLPSSLRIRLGYELGLANIESGSGYEKSYNRAFSVNVGYPLGKIVDKLKKR
ncbi:porin family protein [Spirosoma areae]